MSTESDGPKKTNEESKPARKPRSPRGPRTRFRPNRLRARLETALEHASELEDPAVQEDRARLQAEDALLSSVQTDVRVCQGKRGQLSETYDREVGKLMPILKTIQWALRVRGESWRHYVRSSRRKTAVETAETLLRAARQVELGIPRELVDQLANAIAPARAALDQCEAMENELAGHIEVYNAKVKLVAVCISSLNGAMKRAMAQRRVTP